MIEPIEKEIDGKIYILSKFPAIPGREIITQYPTSAAPKIGDYQINEELMLKLMSYVGIPRGDNLAPLMLTTQSLINNHVPNFEALIKIEWAMMEYNCSFLADGRALGFLEGLATKAQALIMQTLTDFSVQSSKKN